MSISPKPRRWLILIPLALGAAGLMMLAKSRPLPQQAPATESARPVRVLEVPRTQVVPRAIGHGYVQPYRVWEAVVEVTGKLIYRHPELNKGALLQAGTEILRIDPTDYELALQRAKTDLASTRAQLDENAQRERNTRASLRIEQDALALSEKEFARKANLVKQGTVSRSDYDQEQRSLLGQRQSVQGQTNALNLIPAERALLQAQLARQEAQLETAKRDLERTVISLPFTARIAKVNADERQFVRQGEILVEADGISRAEIDAQIPLQRARALVRSEQMLDTAQGDESVRQTLGLSAKVWLRGDAGDVSWDARFSRVSDTLDPKTRTVGFIVEVDKPYADVVPGIRPPLVKGFFVDVELKGKPLPNRVVVPRLALHAGNVYLMDENKRLRIQPVEAELLESTFAVIADGLSGGETLVLSDLSPAIEGMLLAPQTDDDASMRLLADANAAGEAP
ncbi:MAG: efflux RND transporter periplasmic adaptor subunit [Chromatiales bacterium]|nr:efflux RND transporter periplasmic adaptor subunit [Chromatiales bacterium]